MIQPKSPAVLHLNKLSVLLVSLLLLLFWIKFEFPPSPQQTDTNQNKINDSKYIKTLVINPFKRTHTEVSSNDSLPTITTLQSEIPAFLSLQLRLHGIVYKSDQNSYAMISMQGAIQEIYQANEEISEGLYLVNITKKQAEVDYFGERFILNIENSRFDNNVDKPMEVVNYQYTELSFDQQIKLLEVDKQRNPIRLFMIRRPYAVYSNGEFQGYKIMPGSNNDQFKRLGFESGDIITYLNGIEFTGPGKRDFVIQQLTHAMHIDLTVLRDNQVLSINYGF